MVRVTHMPTDFSVLVRAYGKGSELIIDRKQEVIVCKRYGVRMLRHMSKSEYMFPIDCRISSPCLHKDSHLPYMLVSEMGWCMALSRAEYRPVKTCEIRKRRNGLPASWQSGIKYACLKIKSRKDRLNRNSGQQCVAGCKKVEYCQLT